MPIFSQGISLNQNSNSSSSLKIPSSLNCTFSINSKSVLMGFGLDSDAIHSPNEHYGLYNYYKGIESIPYFFEFYAQG